MKTQRNILIAFLLNLAFSVFEFAGGILTGSIAIVSDALHDLGDAVSIGISYFLEKMSKKQPDELYTYEYARYAVLGGAVTTLILLLGSILVFYNGIHRLIRPVEIRYDGMIFMAVTGVCINLGAAYITHGGESVNQRAVNLHMLEDVLGWVAVLIGAVIMRFTDISVLDPILSMGVALFIFVNAMKNLKEIIDLFLEKAPKNISVQAVQSRLCQMDGVLDVHHIHIWSLDGHNSYATMHIVTNDAPSSVKYAVRKALREYGIGHITLELETENEQCQAKHCYVEHKEHHCHHHHHP